MNKIYRISLWVAAVANVATLIMILLSIFVRLFGKSIPGLDAYAGYFIAATFFLAIAETFIKNEHIRVSIILNSLESKKRKFLEMFALLAAVYITGYLLFYSARMTYFSFKFNDVSQLPDATPLWIPQMSFVLGIFVFLIALIDRFVKLITGKDRV